MSTEHAVQTAGNVAPVTTAETLIGTITIPPENQPVGADGVQISGDVSGTSGAGTTAIVVRVRQGVGIAGAIVGAPYTTETTASTAYCASFGVIDPITSYPTGNTYSVTVQQTGATGNGSNVNAFIDAGPVSPLNG